MITSWWMLPLAMLAGGGLGAVFFGGLWLSIQQLAHTRQRAAWLLGSFLGRSALTLLGFYVALTLGWAPLLACMAGFALMRLVLLRQLRPAPAAPESRLP